MNETEWNEVARELKFSSSKAMLVHWYYSFDLTLGQIAERIGCSVYDVRFRMTALDLPIRERDKVLGGA